jgi:hypothetical protein
LLKKGIIMPQVIKNTIKANKVKLEGEVILPNLNKPEEKAEPKEDIKMPIPMPGAIIVEKHEKYAVIEVTCGCGRKTQIMCNY